MHRWFGLAAWRAQRLEASHLADELVEGLRVELLAHRAYPRLARLALLELAVEVLLEVDDVEAGGRRGRHVLHPQLVVLGPLPGGQDRVQQVLRGRRALNGRERGLQQR